MLTMMTEDDIDDALEVDAVSLIELTPTIRIINKVIANMIIIIITWSLPWRAPSS